MRPVLLLSAVTVVAGACASGSGGSGPVMHYAPTARAAEYTVEDRGVQLVEVPGMSIENNTFMTVDLTVTVNDASESGVAIVFDSYSLDVDNDMQPMSHDGTGLVGGTVRGHFAPEAGLVITDRPDVPSELSAMMDPVAYLRALFPAMPADETLESWPHRYEVTDYAAMEVHTVFEGQARFAGDTTVAGRAGRIIISEGVGESSGSGQPAESPVPLEMSATSTIRSVFVWDPTVGELISATIEVDGSGMMMAQGFEIPISQTSNVTVTRKN